MDDVFNVLKSILHGDFIIACIGSPLRSDDRVGLVICEKLAELGFNNIVSCEYGLENCMDEIISRNPTTLLLIDAVYSDRLEPGDIVLLDYSEITGGKGFAMPLTTHNIPLNTIVKILHDQFNIKNIYLLGVMVENIDIGLELTPRVRHASEMIVDTLRNIVKC